MMPILRQNSKKLTKLMRYSAILKIERNMTNMERIGNTLKNSKKLDNNKNLKEEMQKQSTAVIAALKGVDDSAKIVRTEFVGGQVGKELATDGALALVAVCIGIMVYLAFRFEWRFAVATIIANLHDVVIILGLFAAFQMEFSLPVLAAVLAVLGYSVNESVVVFDRVRENFRKMYPEWEKWKAVRDAWDPEHVFQSDLGRRLGLGELALDRTISAVSRSRTL